MNDRAEARRQGLALRNYRTQLLPSLSPNVDSGSGLCRRTYQDASITKHAIEGIIALN